MTRAVAVTGAEGFIGSHLVEALVERGDRVRAMVQYNSFDSWGWLDALPRSIRSSIDVELGDVRDPSSVITLVRGTEVVFHLAALIAIPYSYQAPRSYVETNVVGTLNVLEAVRQAGVARLIHTSTSEVYGTARTVPIDEDHPLQGQSPYAASKIGADKLVESFHLSYGVPAVILRPFNTFGPRQSARAVIPTILSQVLAVDAQPGMAISVKLGDLRPTRDFTHVQDTARAFLAVADAPLSEVVGRVLNCGTGEETSIGQLLGLVGEIAGCQVDAVRQVERIRPPGSEVYRLVCDSGRLQRATGWTPTRTLREGLAETMAWLRDPENLARYRPDRFAR